MPKYSGKEVSKAGDILIQQQIAETDNAAYNQAMEILSYWRACHETPLMQAVAMLTEAAKKYDAKAVIAKRLKRTPSVINKLQRFQRHEVANNARYRRL